MKKQLPLVVVLGATACGKSKLAIDIARRFGGEIISADSMQVYHGLDIVTNKVTEEEQSLAKHYMINFLNPMNRYSVVDFKRKSLDIIDNLLEKDKLPIVVGGTNYYIESLIWKSFLIEREKNKSESNDSYPPSSAIYEGVDCMNTLIDSETKILNQLSEESLHTDEDLNNIELFFKKPIYNDAFKHISSEKLWKILEQVDPNAAHLYHLNDKRRIIRCLQIIQEKGKNYSDLLKEVNKSCRGEDKPSLGGPLRFESTCVLWLNCDNNILDKILDDRVDQMLDRGLLAELENFHEDYNKNRLDKQTQDKPDYEKGIFQTIGFKEFHDYLMLDATMKATLEGNEILKKSIDQMKLSTRRYAKTQLKWIRRRFLQVGTRDLPPVFKIETCFDEARWSEKVSDPACNIVECFIKGETLSQELSNLMQEPDNQAVANRPGKFYCEPCDRTFIGSHYIETHLKSKTHERKRDQFKKKKQRIEEA